MKIINSIVDYFQKRPYLSFIISLVVFGHIVLLLIVAKYESDTKIANVVANPLIVRTVNLKSSKKKFIEKPKKAIKKQKKAIIKKDVSKKNSATYQLNKRKKLQDILKKVKENIAKIDENPHNLSQENLSAKQSENSPQLVINLSSDEEYISLLVNYLENLLTFPEHGDVNLSLTIRKDGIIESFYIISSESEKNVNYLKSELPKTKMPSFGKNTTKTFKISLNTR